VPSHEDELRRAPIAGVESSNGSVVVRLAGELDLYNAEQVKTALQEAAARRPERLVVDLAGVSFVDSTALAVLIDARRRLQGQAAFRLAAPGHEVRRALEISGLDRHLPVHASVDDALRSTI